MKTEKEVVEAHLEAHSRHDVDALMSLYDEDVTFEVVGDDPIVGKSAVRQSEEYHAALNGKWRFFDYVSEPGQISFKSTVKNDYYRILGVAELRYPSNTMTIRDGLITSVRIALSQESREQVRQAEEAFDAWVTKEKPEIVAKLAPDGKFVPGKESALELMALLREWQAVQA